MNDLVPSCGGSEVTYIDSSLSLGKQVKGYGLSLEESMSIRIGIPGIDTGRITTHLQLVLDKIITWRSQQLPVNDTDSSEKMLTSIIKALKSISSSDVPLEIQVAALYLELKAEVEKREKLELQVVDLNRKVALLTSRDVDLKVINYLMDVFGLLKNFIMRIEMSTGIYSPDFKKLNDRDVMDSLYVEPIDNILDSYDEKVRKTKLQTHTDEAHKFFKNLALDPNLVFNLNKKIRVRNVFTLSLDNKLYKSATYVQEKQADFLNVVSSLTPQNELAPDKHSITDLVKNMSHLHGIMLQKITTV